MSPNLTSNHQLINQQSHASELQIHLDNDTLIMHGSEQESSGCVLRGHVRLNLKEPTKFKSLTLRLTGKIRVAWSECKLLLYLLFKTPLHTTSILISNP